MIRCKVRALHTRLQALNGRTIRSKNTDPHTLGFRNKIILECRLQEQGAKPVHGGWVRSSGWSFNCSQKLTNYLESVFKGFKFQKHHGTVDRQREIMTFVKEPAMVVDEI